MRPYYKMCIQRQIQDILAGAWVIVCTSKKFNDIELLNGISKWGQQPLRVRHYSPIIQGGSLFDLSKFGRLCG